MSLHDRLKNAIDKKGVTPYKIGQDTPVSRALMGKYLTGDTEPSVKNIILLAKYLDIDLNWLLTGEGYMSKRDTDVDKYEENYNNKIVASEPKVSRYNLKTDYYGVERQSIPLYELDASAGLNTLFSTQNTQVPLDYITVPNAPKCDGALFVRGDSMYPILKAGDIICYKTILNLDNLIYGEMYVLDIDNGDDEFLTVKFVKKSDKGDKYVTLVSENKHHADKDIPLKQIRALAIIKLSIRYNTIS